MVGLGGKAVNTMLVLRGPRGKVVFVGNIILKLVTKMLLQVKVQVVVVCCDFFFFRFFVLFVFFCVVM